MIQWVCHAIIMKGCDWQITAGGGVIQGGGGGGVRTGKTAEMGLCVCKCPFDQFGQILYLRYARSVGISIKKGHSTRVFLQLLHILFSLVLVCQWDTGRAQHSRVKIDWNKEGKCNISRPMTGLKWCGRLTMNETFSFFFFFFTEKYICFCVMLFFSKETCLVSAISPLSPSYILLKTKIS